MMGIMPNFLNYQLIDLHIHVTRTKALISRHWLHQYCSILVVNMNLVNGYYPTPNVACFLSISDFELYLQTPQGLSLQKCLGSISYFPSKK